MGAASETPSSSSSDQTLYPLKSETPSSVGYAREASEEIDALLQISEADLNIINSIGNEQTPTNSPKHGQSNVKQSQSGISYDIRGNQIHAATLPNVTHHKPKALRASTYQPRTASLGSLTFPTTTTPETTQDPCGN